MKTALIQFNAKPDKMDNIRRALLFVEEAIGRGAQFVLLPEVFHYRGDLNAGANLKNVAENIPGASLRPLMDLAGKHKIFILAGSVVESSSKLKKAYNTSVLIDNKGEIQVKYRKINLFDARLKTTSVKESKIFMAGRKPVVGKVGKFSIGMSVCYDLRFPELYQTYRRRGVHILSVPSCFTRTTGQAHWEVLLRARAIETQSFVLAPNQVGQDARGVESYGNSMAISPWGEILVRGSDQKEEILFTNISLDDIKKSQNILPGFRKNV